MKELSTYRGTEYEPLLENGTLGSLERYEKDGIPTGDFLRCVCENDLFGAVAHADFFHQAYLALVVRFVYNEMPNGTHGFRGVQSSWREFIKNQKEVKNA